MHGPASPAPSAAGQTAKWVGRCGECQAWGTVVEDAGAPAAAHLGARTRRTVGASDRPGRRRRRRAPGPPASASWTGCSAAVSCPARWCCWPASPASASRPCCWTWPAGPAGRRRAGCSTSPARSPPPRSGCAPSGSARCTTGCYLAAETDLGAVLGHVEASSPTCWSSTRCRRSPPPVVDGSPGGVAQVREVAAALIRVAKERGIADPAGRARHQGRRRRRARARWSTWSTSWCQFEGDRHSRLRLRAGDEEPLRPHRRGRLLRPAPTTGIVGLADPSGLFVSHGAAPVPGTCVTVTLEGRRPLATEVQALVVAEPARRNPRRTTSGVDSSRLAMVLAVAQRRAALAARATGTSTSPRWAGCGSPSRPPTWPSRSPWSRRPPTSGSAADLVAVGEVGLAGEVRTVAGRAAAGWPRPRGSASAGRWCPPAPGRTDPCRTAWSCSRRTTSPRRCALASAGAPQRGPRPAAAPAEH